MYVSLLWYIRMMWYRVGSIHYSCFLTRCSPEKGVPTEHLNASEDLFLSGCIVLMKHGLVDSSHIIDFSSIYLEGEHADLGEYGHSKDMSRRDSR